MSDKLNFTLEYLPVAPSVRVERKWIKSLFREFFFIPLLFSATYCEVPFTENYFICRVRWVTFWVIFFFFFKNDMLESCDAPSPQPHCHDYKLPNLKHYSSMAHRFRICSSIASPSQMALRYENIVSTNIIIEMQKKSSEHHITSEKATEVYKAGVKYRVTFFILLTDNQPHCYCFLFQITLCKTYLASITLIITWFISFLG